MTAVKPESRPVDGPARWEMAEIIREAMREADPSTWGNPCNAPDPWKVAFVAVDALDVWVRARVAELDAAVPIIET